MKNEKIVKQKKTTVPQCGECPAICCHDLSITIEAPRTENDREILLWQMNYDSVKTYVRNRRWHVLVAGRCRNLGEDNLCSIYERRYDQCRSHMPPHCERFGEWYDVMFHTREELQAYFDKQKRRKKRAKLKRLAAKA